MSGVFSSFKPYNDGSDKYSATIFMSAQDRHEEVIVDMRAISCKDGFAKDRQWEWPKLSLAGFRAVEMQIKEDGSDEIHAIILGVPMQPLEDGLVLFRIPGEVFGQKYGKYIGLIEVRYEGSDRSGDRIITARNYIPFEVREDFYCDPFDPDFDTCAGGN